MKANIPLTAAECMAKVAAYEECVMHLNRDWTSDPLEREFGKQIAVNLNRMANRWRSRAESKMKKERSNGR